MTRIDQYTRICVTKSELDVWKKDSGVKGALGAFEVELRLPRGAEPRGPILQLAQQMTDFVAKDTGEIAAILQGHFLKCVEDWGIEVVLPFLVNETCHEQEITGARLFDLYGGGTIVIFQHDAEGVHLHAFVFFEVPYDVEHGLSLEYRDGRITEVNERYFKLEHGRLKFDDGEVHRSPRRRDVLRRDQEDGAIQRITDKMRQNAEKRCEPHDDQTRPEWWLSFSSPVDGTRPDSRLLQLLMTVLSLNTTQALSAYQKLAQGKAIPIPLNKRSDWSAVRFEFAELGIKADLKATYHEAK